MKKKELIKKFNTQEVKNGSLLKLTMGILSVVAFVIGHIYSVSLFLYAGVFLMVANFVLFPDDLLCFELLYLPLVNILKLSPTGASLLSYISLVGVAVFLLKRKSVNIDISTIFVAVAFFVLILFKGLFQGFAFSMAYVRLVITMAVTAIYVKTKVDDSKMSEKDINQTNVFLSCGVILSSVIGFVFVENVNLSRFLTSDAQYVGGKLVSRFSGVSADPNYFSALVIFAIAANLFCFIQRPRFLNIVFAVVLAIFGLLSLSKMFLILLIVILILFLFSWIKEKGFSNSKNITVLIVLILGLCLGMHFILNSDSVQLILMRMDDSANINDFTTNRSDTWIKYAKALWDDFNFFFIGVDNNDAVVGRHVTHNTFIQIWWKLGLVGIGLVLTWFVLVWNKCKKKNISGTLMMFVGCLGAAIAIDLLFFEQFFWFFAFFVICRQAAYNKEIKSCISGLVPEDKSR